MAKRNEFTLKTKAAVRERSGGICEMEGCNRPATQVDHIDECADDENGGDNSLENARDMCDECHLVKTNWGKAGRAKQRRFAPVKGRPKSGKIKSPGFQSGTRKIQSAGFQKGARKIPSRKLQSRKMNA